MKEHTGLYYTDGSPVMDGDTYETHHHSENNFDGIKFIRQVKWEPLRAAYVSFDPVRWGVLGYLHDDFTNVNLISIRRLT